MKTYIKRNLYINMVPVTSGGGLQNALSFLDHFAKAHESEGLDKYVVACVENGGVHRFCIDKSLNCVTIKPGKLSRALYELVGGAVLIKRFDASLVFSLFGGAPLTSFGVYKISGFAYSNIIQSEIDFWGFLPRYKRLVKKITDCFRLFSARLVDEIILETNYLANRARDGVFSGKTVHVVDMAPTALVEKGLAKTIAKSEQLEGLGNKIDLLYLAGPHPNKRIHRLAEVFSELNQKSEKPFRLVVTLPVNSSYFNTVKAAFQKFGVSESLINIGPVNPECVGELLTKVQGVINVALLESFSNNWVEAWVAEVPLIVTSAEWSRASCGRAAIYIDVDDAGDACSRILSVFINPMIKSTLLMHGKERLKNLPTSRARYCSYMKIICGGFLKGAGR